MIPTIPNSELAAVRFAAKRQLFLFFCILVLTATLRFFAMPIPALDRSMWKEIDYIEISRNYAAHGMHFLQPEITWPAQPPRVTAMEFPAVPYAAAVLYKLFGFHVLTVRLIPLLAYLLMAAYVFLLVRDQAGPELALLASLIAGLMPIHHPFGRILFSEPVSVCMSVATLFHFSRWVVSRRIAHSIAAAAAFSIAVSVKLEPLFLLLPLAYIWWSERKRTELHLFAAFVTAALVLPTCWFLYAFYLSRTSIDVFGVVPFIQGHNKLQTLTLIRDSHFWLTLGHRIWSLSWGVLGVPFLLVGLILALRERKPRLLLAYAGTILLYFVLVAEGQLDAPYRQLNAVPVLSFFIALGLLRCSAYVLQRFSQTVPLDERPAWNQAFAAACLLTVLIFLPSYAAELREGAAQAAYPKAWALAQQIRGYALPGDSMVILGEYTEHVGGNDLGPVLYYYTGLQGWTVNEKQLSAQRLQDLIKQGATLFVVDPEFAFAKGFDSRQTAAFVDAACRKYSVLYREGLATVLRLQKPAALGKLVSRAGQ